MVFLDTGKALLKSTISIREIGQLFALTLCNCKLVNVSWKIQQNVHNIEKTTLTTLVIDGGNALSWHVSIMIDRCKAKARVRTSEGSESVKKQTV